MIHEFDIQIKRVIKEQQIDDVKPSVSKVKKSKRCGGFIDDEAAASSGNSEDEEHDDANDSDHAFILDDENQ